jgi:hypothetical protein
LLGAENPSIVERKQQNRMNERLNVDSCRCRFLNGINDADGREHGLCVIVCLAGMMVGMWQLYFTFALLPVRLGGNFRPPLSSIAIFFVFNFDVMLSIVCWGGRVA